MQPWDRFERSELVEGMKRIKVFIFFILAVSLFGAPLSDIYEEGLGKIPEFREKVKNLHPFLSNLYPVAVCKGDTLRIYEWDANAEQYRFLKQVQPAFPIPEGIRAAFPLQEIDGRFACVVSPDVFDSLAGYVTIFHEFIHCYQGGTVEMPLKRKLGVAQKSMENKDFMWELNYDFPYEDEGFVKAYSDFLDAVKNDDDEAIMRARRNLRQALDVHAYEYLVWQEWKEGFARFIENMMRSSLDIPKNDYGLEQPFSRISFYVGGSRYIRHLTQRNPDLLTDIEKLFYKILDTD